MEREHRRQSKIIGIKRFKFPNESGAMSLTPLTPPLPPRKVRLCHIFFALLAMNDPLPAELNCTENIDLKYLLLFTDLQLEGYIYTCTESSENGS